MANKIVNLNEVIKKIAGETSGTAANEAKKIILAINDIYAVIASKLDPAGKNFKNINDNVKNIKVVQDGSIIPLLKTFEDFNTKNSEMLSSKLDKFKNINQIVDDIIDILYKPGNTTEHTEASGLLYNIHELNNRIGSTNNVGVSNIMEGGKLSKDVVESFDAIKAIMDIVADLVDEKKNPLISNPVSFLIIKLKIKQTFRHIRSIIKLVQNELSKISIVLDKEDIAKPADVVKSVNSVMDCVVRIMDSVIKLESLFLKFVIVAPISLLAIKLLKKYLECLKQTLDEIVKIKFDENSIETIQNTIENIINISELLVSLVCRICLLALLMRVGIIATKIVLLGVFFIFKKLAYIAFLIKRMSKSFNKKLTMHILNIKLVIGAIKTICLDIIILALAIVPVVLASIIILIGISILWLVFRGIIFFVNLIGKSINTQLIVNLAKISLVILAIILVTALIVILAIELLILQVVAMQINVGVIALFLLGMVLLVVIYAVLGYVAIAASAVLLPGALGILLTIVVLITITAVLIALAAVLLGLQKVAENFDSNTITTIASFLGGIVVLAAAYTAIGAAAVAAHIVLIPAMAGIMALVGAMTVITMALMGLAKSLEYLQGVTIDKDKIINNVDIVLDTATHITEALEKTAGAGDQIKGGLVGKFFHDIGLNDTENEKKVKAVLGKYELSFDILKDLTEILNDIQEIELDKDAVLNNVNVIFATADTVLNKIMNETTDEKDEASWFGFGDSENEDKIEAVLGKYELSFDILEDLVDILKDIQAIKLESDPVLNNVEVIFTCADAVLDKIMNETTDEKDEASWFGFGDSENEDKIEAVLGKYELSFDILEDLVSLLKDIQAIKLESDPILNNVEVIFGAADAVLNKIMSQTLDEKDEASWFGLGDSENEDKIQAVMGKYDTAFEGLKTLVDTIRGVQEIKLDSKELGKKVDGVFETANKVLQNVMSSTLYKASPLKINTYVTTVSSIADAVGKFNKAIGGVDVEKTERALTSYNNFIKRIGDTDLNKLQTTTQLFKEMAKFSESINGNFEELAQTINEEIAPLLKELKEAFDKVEQGVKENNTIVASNSTVNREEIKADMVSKGQDKGLSDQEFNKRIDRKLNEIMRNNTGISDLISKMSQLISLFQEGNARVKVNNY